MLTAKQREMWRVNKYIWASLAFIFAWLWARHDQFEPGARRRIWPGRLAAGCANLALRSWIAFRSPAGHDRPVGLGLQHRGHRPDRRRRPLHRRHPLRPVAAVHPPERHGDAERLRQGRTAAAGADVRRLHRRRLADRRPTAFVTRLFFLCIVSAIARRLYLNAEERSRQLAALREQLGVAEEKSRVARELHDGLGREIVNVILGLEVARRAAEKKPEQVPALLEENLALLRVAMDDTRALIFQTRPWTLEGDGCAAFTERLERYARQFADRTGLAVQVHCELGDAAFGPQAGLRPACAIVQEALNNVAKHAQATEVAIDLHARRQDADRAQSPTMALVFQNYKLW